MKINSSVILEVLAGISLALILPTRYRIGGGVGVGEIGIALLTSYYLLSGVLKKVRLRMAGGMAMPITLLVFIFSSMLPVTAIHVVFGTQGTTFRDFFAYLLSFLFVMSLAVSKANLQTIIRSLIITLLVILAYQYALGGEEAWYATRFTGGAKNPNQLALYIVCTTALVWIGVRRGMIRWTLLGILVFFGITTISDAYTAYLAAVSIAIITVFLVPPKYFVLSGILIFMLLIFVAITWGADILFIADEIWGEADEGGERLTLYLNGLSAWVHSPFSIIFGNGAGSFSGESGPFGLSEAHDTPIDTLAMAGVLGFVVFYAFPFLVVRDLYRANLRIVFAMTLGLMAFSFFHYVARHPIYWFTLYALVGFVHTQRQEEKQPCAA